ncbi:MAG: proline racemase family protein [Casimicrobiaceae bacterium]
MSRDARTLLLLPGCRPLVMAALFALPMVVVAVWSLGNAQDRWTFDSYARVLLDRYHWSVLATTFRIAGLATLWCVLIGFPLAYYLVRLVRWPLMAPGMRDPARHPAVHQQRGSLVWMDGAARPRGSREQRHPTSAHIHGLNFVTLWHAPTLDGAFYKNVHVFSAGQLDRSPGGTGTSAMLAMFEARGRIAINQPIRSEGLLGTGTFEVCLIGETKLGSVRAVRPTVKGTASLLGTARWVIDPRDPVGAGFLVQCPQQRHRGRLWRVARPRPVHRSSRPFPVGG